MRKVYVKSSAQISSQLPLCDAWMENPLELYSDKVNPPCEPDWKRFVSPLEARRMTGLMKRALAVSAASLEDAGLAVPEAVVCGTGLGLQENTEAFLTALCSGERTSLRPVHFMQSTHNTLASLIGIRTGSHGYNATYSHGGLSFESALDDAWTQLRMGRFGNALVGAFDEVTHFSYSVYSQGSLHAIGIPSCGSAVAFVVDTKAEGALCEIAAVRLLFRPSEEKMRESVEKMLSCKVLKISDVGLVISIDGLCGPESGGAGNAVKEMFKGVPQGRYGHIFGSCPSASAAGMYAAVACFRHGYVPKSLLCYCESGSDRETPVPDNILLYNRSGENGHSFILLRVCGE